MGIDKMEEVEEDKEIVKDVVAKEEVIEMDKEEVIEMDKEEVIEMGKEEMEQMFSVKLWVEVIKVVINKKLECEKW